ncbi:ComF family protein [Lujinxingia vulgaris]|uniref:ComF family protein n=1 Tax=Lujinxingia vulgaris TaxID=2600176 RepID=A0A5C6XMT1_9DELT|nr:phosphoribosyltransferase family protein [Lujinxingia vulgaris]TXD39566.1 ComF family protein [Lujinxingia vulgaris]
MPQRLVHLLQHAVDRLLPPGCAACDDPALCESAFCAICEEDSYLLPSSVCPRCALPLPLSRSPYASPASSAPCPGCARRPHSPITGTTALWEYEGAVSEALRRIKYSGDLVAAQSLLNVSAMLLAPTLRALPPSLLIPVPARPENLRERGFHLPSLLARRWAKGTHHNAALFALQKTRRTLAQASLGLAERSTNLRDAFKARQARLPHGPVVLVDDVLTTGATLDAAASALQEAGVEKIHALVLARSLPRQ